MENEEITLRNVDWHDRKAVIEAFCWFSNLDEADKQEYIDSTTYEDARTLSSVLMATRVFIELVGDNGGFDQRVLADFSGRMAIHALEEGWV